MVEWLVAKLASVCCDGCEGGVGRLRWLRWSVAMVAKVVSLLLFSNWVFPELISKVMVFNKIFHDCL